MELWGGVECTVNRTGDRFRDQTRLSGHHDRLGDLALIADLGVRALRYPVLWERVAPEHPERRDWRWSDERLAEIDRLGMRAIVGLLHHGSGPAYTSLVSDDFVALFTDYAAAAAERHPGVVEWTPINEPLTTARFSTLYGHWYPHTRDERSFWTALLNQVDATRGAMKAIRRVVPGARLIQTEDLGQVYATPSLADVADYYNDRRWLTWDLLTGRVARDHPSWSQADALGFGDRLRAIGDDPCPPDVIGVNYYPTSERFIDDREEPYAAALPEVGYHDLSALRVLDPPPPGLNGLLRQSWERYGLPLAVTECHLGCTREEQVRWLWQSWRKCAALRDDGVDVQALTAWALFGSIDWDSLITTDADHYEPGAFDIRGGTPRPTAIAGVIGLLGAGAGEVGVDHPVRPIVSGPGWWQRDVRLEHPPVAWPGEAAVHPETPTQPILITGATGTLGQAFAGACRLRGLPYILTDRASLPITEADQVARALDLYQPWAVINAAGWVRVDDAEDRAAECHRVNGDGAAILAAACAARGVHCTIFSSDLVFDGRATRPYIEEDAVGPLNAYGRSKAFAEERALFVAPATLVVRTAAFFSPYDEHNFAIGVERALLAGQTFVASSRHVVTPTFVPDLVRICLDLAIDGEGGLWHLTNQEPVSWLTFGRRIADALNLASTLVVPGDENKVGWRAERPRYAALGSSRGRMLPSLDDALARHAAVRLRGRKAVHPALC